VNLEESAMKTGKKVSIKVNAGITEGELKYKWRFIGYDENNYTHTPEGEELISMFGRLEDSPYYIRAHHMLCTGNLHGTYKWGSTNVYTARMKSRKFQEWLQCRMITVSRL